MVGSLAAWFGVQGVGVPGGPHAARTAGSRDLTRKSLICRSKFTALPAAAAAAISVDVPRVVTEAALPPPNAPLLVMAIALPAPPGPPGPALAVDDPAVP